MQSDRECGWHLFFTHVDNGEHPFGRHSVNVIWLVGWLLSEYLSPALTLGHQNIRNEVVCPALLKGPCNDQILSTKRIIRGLKLSSSPMQDYFCGNPDKWLSAILEHCSD